ncbi:hypothetical protein BO78DRAFT_418132 [Aspergillus sclerotiicarbonarius CBS 121057]|uniref:Uncharacterized protein n=1 Tax=Aspergillus sclerotiicarbonarius (strain CBS 121057 / IBT 28362) TaxID=1448318 RepID=A0A319ESY9_ASPSB|nr:hypothetical protein BO78DRAFT_418132 [Aspergillus sclerotiicarbonarius CBS 121057]
MADILNHLIPPGPETNTRMRCSCCASIAEGGRLLDVSLRDLMIEEYEDTFTRFFTYLPKSRSWSGKEGSQLLKIQHRSYECFKRHALHCWEAEDRTWGRLESYRWKLRLDDRFRDEAVKYATAALKRYLDRSTRKTVNFSGSFRYDTETPTPTPKKRQRCSVSPTGGESSSSAARKGKARAR